MANLSNASISFLLIGAAEIKKNTASFKAQCATLSTHSAVHNTVKNQLLAASTAVSGKTNTGLNERGWRPLAEVIGMVSSKSVKLIDSSPENKTLVLKKFLTDNHYPSTRVNKAGGSKAIKDATQAADLVQKGVWSLAKDGKEIRAMQAEVLSQSDYQSLYEKAKADKAAKKSAATPAVQKPTRGRANKAA